MKKTHKLIRLLLSDFTKVSGACKTYASATLSRDKFDALRADDENFVTSVLNAAAIDRENTDMSEWGAATKRVVTAYKI